MNQGKRAFTLIELIIVVVIIGILALIAIPRYFVNVDKAQKTQAFSNLNAMNQAAIGYYAAYGTWPTIGQTDGPWPITVVIDGDTIYNVPNPSVSGRFTYRHGYFSYASYAGYYCGQVLDVTHSNCLCYVCVNGYVENYCPHWGDRNGK
jgi:prepilin-type N-terminal cleavage/methylation domain-containing protein